MIHLTTKAVLLNVASPPMLLVVNWLVNKKKFRQWFTGTLSMEGVSYFFNSA